MTQLPRRDRDRHTALTPGVAGRMADSVRPPLMGGFGANRQCAHHCRDAAGGQFLVLRPLSCPNIIMIDLRTLLQPALQRGGGLFAERGTMHHATFLSTDGFVVVEVDIRDLEAL